MPGLPSYQVVKAALLQDIRQGNYRPQDPFITEREICARFDVSRTTAVRALNDLVHAGVLTRRRGRGTFVVDRVAPLDAEPVADTARLIGCIFYRLTTQNPITMLRGIEQLCRETDYHLLLFDSKGDAQTEATNIQRALKAGVDGLIISPVDSISNAESIERLQRADIPFVLLDGFYPTLPTHVVTYDHVALGYEVTNCLIRRGHRHIALIYGTEIWSTTVLDSFTGYRLAMREHDLSIEPDVATLRPYVQLAKQERFDLLSGWLSAPYRPTAYLAINRQSMMAVVTDLLALGLRIPDDAEIAVMDDVTADDLLTPVVAAASVPRYEMGRAALRLLLENLARPANKPAVHTVLPISIVAPTPVRVSLQAVAT